MNATIKASLFAGVLYLTTLMLTGCLGDQVDTTFGPATLGQHNPDEPRLFAGTSYLSTEALSYKVGYDETLALLSPNAMYGEVIAVKDGKGRLITTQVTYTLEYSDEQRCQDAISLLQAMRDTYQFSAQGCSLPFTSNHYSTATPAPLVITQEIPRRDFLKLLSLRASA